MSRLPAFLRRRRTSGPPPPDEPGDLTAGQDPEQAQPASPSFRERGRLRRRLRYLRRLRELQLRDAGGLVYDLRRFGRENPDLVRKRLDGIASTDAELRGLETTLDDRRPLWEVTDPALGGMCPRCAAYYPLDAHFCADCGLDLRIAAAQQAQAAGSSSAEPGALLGIIPPGQAAPDPSGAPPAPSLADLAAQGPPAGGPSEAPTSVQSGDLLNVPIPPLPGTAGAERPEEAPGEGALAEHRTDEPAREDEPPGEPATEVVPRAAEDAPAAAADGPADADAPAPADADAPASPAPGLASGDPLAAGPRAKPEGVAPLAAGEPLGAPADANGAADEPRTAVLREGGEPESP